MNIYVGNLSYDVTEADLQAAFEAFGAVASARIITDRMTARIQVKNSRIYRTGVLRDPVPPLRLR